MQWPAMKSSTSYEVMAARTRRAWIVGVSHLGLGGVCGGRCGDGDKDERKVRKTSTTCTAFLMYLTQHGGALRKWRRVGETLSSVDRKKIHITFQEAIARLVREDGKTSCLPRVGHVLCLFLRWRRHERRRNSPAACFQFMGCVHCNVDCARLILASRNARFYIKLIALHSGCVRV